MQPDYVLCVECETPCYLFEWKEDQVAEATCEVCGNDDPVLFMTEDDWDAYSHASPH